jgi:hypothetical protein
VFREQLLVVDCLAQEQNGQMFFLYLAGSGIRTSGLSVIGPMLLTRYATCRHVISI